MGLTLAVLKAFWKTTCKNARGCFKSLPWFLKILTGILREPKLLLWLRFVMSFSISV